MDISIPENVNVNLEQYGSTLEQCIKKVVNFHGTTYHNICDGSITFVQAGFIEYILKFTLIALMSFLIIMCATFVVTTIRDELF